ncbi:MAG: U32 family peptidase [Ignavibacteriales bacterium]|nr:U32 family peptidase [Ignavibacteriales bacterium]
MSVTSKQTSLELLSPARDLECGLAAINHGADAVYVGAPKFGARAAAGNPLKDIGELISYAHRYWARVYITLNTILYDSELEEARSMIHQLYDAGADALIIQDMGLLELDLPPIPLFASTQTHNYNLDRIQFLERVGIQRVILARELSLEQLSEIRKGTTLDLEFFVHGALCVSFSGQCYFSQAAMGRSANRGECAQMCRLPYTLTDGRGDVLACNQHVLSLKDLNLSDYLSNLVDAGVTSFKIEGRLKEVSYVKNITAFYRAKLDAVIEEREGFRRSSSGRTSFFFTPDPEKTFNRGTTDYFIRRRTPEIVSLRTPKSVGKLLGTVQSVGSGFFVLQTTDEFHNGDGICFFGEDDELMGINVNRVEVNRIFPNSMEGIEPGVVVYRNYDHEFVQLLKSDSARRTVDVDFTFNENLDGFELRAVDENGNEATHRLTHTKEIARKHDTALKAIKTQLSKLGDTIFNAKSVTIEATQAFYLPVRVLNQLRRDCVAALEAERLRNTPRQVKTIAPNDFPYPEKRLTYSANVVNEKAAAFYRRHGVQEIEKGLELQNDASGKILMTTRHCLKFQFDLCRGEKGSAEELYLSDGKTSYKLDFDCEQCVMKIVAP